MRPSEWNQQKVTDTEWAYLAGIIDGEGNLYVSPKGAVALRVTSGDTEVVRWLEATFPGKAHPHKNSKYNPNARDIERWEVTDSASISSILAGVLPYLLAKKERAEAVFLLVGARGTDRQEKTAALRALPLRGTLRA